MNYPLEKIKIQGVTMRIAFLLLLLCPTVSTGQMGNDGVGVMEFLTSLVADSSLPVDQSQVGWIIVDDPSNHTRYYFTSNTKDPAHPAVFKRVVFKEGESIKIGTDVNCEGDKRVCEEILNSFMQQDEKIRRQMQGE